MNRAQLPQSAGPRWLALAALGLTVLSGCQAEVLDPNSNAMAGSGAVGTGASAGLAGSTATGGMAGAGVGGAGGSTAGAAGSGAGAGGGGAGVPVGCTDSDVITAKRIVRLTFNQITSTIRDVIDPTIASEITTDFDIPDATHRTFPPLASPREGATVTDSQYQLGDNIAQAVGDYVEENFATVVTECAGTPADACAQAYILRVAARAFRRPLTDAESTRLTSVYTAVKSNMGTVENATRFAIYAVFNSPLFLYRTEFGAEGQAVGGALNPYELASQIALFLTDAPPDQALLDAAGNGSLATVEGMTAQVDRLLSLPATKANLESAMFSYLALTSLETVIITDDAFTTGVRNSMYHEGELFLRNALWSGPLAGLLTSRQTFINSQLAPIYGVTPPTQVDADGFGLVELPATRAGILTLTPFLSARTRPDLPSVIGRGLAVNAAFLCAQNPPFPEDPAIVAEVEAASEALAEESERVRAEYRATTALCAGCHIGFDAYGLALTNFDGIGRYITVDPQNRPIDASVTLPPDAGGGTAANAAEMATLLSQSSGVTKCMARNFLAYALADEARGRVEVAGCAAQKVAETFAASPDKSFTSLVRAVALSNTVSQRVAGGAQ